MQPLPPPRRSGPQSTALESRDTVPPSRTMQSSLRPAQQEPSESMNPTSLVGQSSGAAEGPVKKRRKHRGKKKKNRRQSFAAMSETSTMPEVGGRGMLEDLTEEAAVLGASRPSIYHRESNPSNDSLDSEALLDHREQPMMRPRRESRAGIFGTSHRALLAGAGSSSYRQENGSRQRRNTRTRTDSSRRLDADEDADDRTPLIGAPFQQESPTEGYGLFKPRSRQRRGSHSTTSSRPKGFSRSTSFPPLEQEYDVNNPPSVPPSPQLGEYGGVDDVMVPAGEYLTRSPDSQRNLAGRSRDALIDMEGNGADDLIGISAPPSPRLHPEGVQRRRTIGLPTSDVCFPTTTMSELADEDFDHLGQRTTHETRRRRRRRGYPQLWVLDEWSREEKEARMGGIRAKKIAEPVLVEGRLRPSKADWHREEEDVPFRYTYFNEDLESTIHAQTISELLQPGQTFRNLFIPDPIELSDTDSDTEPEGPPDIKEAVDPNLLSPKSQNGDLGHPPNYLDSSIANMKLLSGTSSGKGSKQESGADTPAQPASPVPNTPKPKRYGRRPAFWLDVMCPTNQEMQTLCKTFGIHALTAEDIMMQEAREKVELFRHYYFLNYRTFEQDIGHEEYMEPLNMYVIVFEGGVISFHWTQIPHPANVRRRIRQLTDYLELSPDWIAYAIIDDITDVYQPLINTCESEVDAVDEQILQLFEKTAALANKAHPDEKASVASKEKKSSFDLLLRVGETRKKVMSLYRLLSTKADVIKGFAKRCNEDFSVAPRSEIGLYLGDIQDHILTMTSNLGHYESLLSRAHSNYLAQINIKMNERQEQTADILGKVTVIGTVALPLSVVSGLWGMNVKVPGQVDENDTVLWFFVIISGMAVFAVGCFVWARRIGII